VAFPERIVPDETSPGIVAVHLKRYEFAGRWSAGADVLDAGCGVGYGTAHLAARAKHVLGVDRDLAAVEYARRRYGAPNIEFRHADLLELRLPSRSFDLVCAFETIEHLDEPAVLVQLAADVLRPNGVFVVSTPRADATSHAPENPHHRVELSAHDLERLLRAHFGEVELYGQRRLQTRRHLAAQRADVLGLRKRFSWLEPLSRLLGTQPMRSVSLDGIVIEREAIERASELVAVCFAPVP